MSIKLNEIVIRILRLLKIIKITKFAWFLNTNWECSKCNNSENYACTVCEKRAKY